MSLTFKPVYQSRSFICAPYRYDFSCGQWQIAEAIASCPKKSNALESSCHVVKGRQRHRKVGPSHPLWVLKCDVHACWFTVYPLGWLPFGRRAIVELDSQGESVLSGSPWDNTAFGAAIDEERGKVWPMTSAGVLRSSLEGIDCYGVRKTQLRHILGGGQLFGLVEKDNSHQQMTRLELGINQRAYQEAHGRIRDGPWPAALGTACTGLLRNFAQPSMLTLTKIMHLGQILGFWGAWANHSNTNSV